MILNIIKKDFLNLIEISNDTGLKITLCDLGASIYEIKLNDDVLNYGIKDLELYKMPNVFYGKTIGRYAGRISGARWRDVMFEPNEDNNLLHGGKYGLHTKNFKYKIDSQSNLIKVTFSTSDSGKKSGFPGKFNFSVIYKIYKDKNKLEINFKSKCSEDCPINPTNHVYFGLNSNSNDDLKLNIKASKFVEIDAYKLPISISEVDKKYDFRKLKKITKDVEDSSYDNLYLFDEDSIRKPKLILKNDSYQVKLYTDLPAVQIYTNRVVKYPNSLIEDHDSFASIAIEPQLNTYSIENTVLKANEVRKNKIIYVFDSISK